MNQNAQTNFVICLTLGLFGFYYVWTPLFVVLCAGVSLAASISPRLNNQGEMTSKNGEQPMGRITQSTYSYKKDSDTDSIPQISSKTVTSVIGSGARRSSGPRIEEITDGSQSTTTSRRYSKEYTVEEDNTVSSDRRRSSTGLNQDNVRAFTSILRNKDANVRKSSLETSESETKTTKTTTHDESSKKSLTRGDSIKALQHKYQQATEAANQHTNRSYPKAGLILRSNSLHSADDQPQLSSSMKQASTTVHSSRTTDQDGAVVTSSQTRTENSRTSTTSSTSPGSIQTASTTRTDVRTGATSFLDNSSKVTGVQDILTRMRNADLVTESGDTSEDAEARALLNKFLGASVILQGMEQGMRAATQSSTTLVNEADKQWVKAASRRNQDEIDDISDEKQLRILLDASSDYEEKRKIRAKLREMAEKKGGSSLVAGEGGSGISVEGECLNLQRVMSGGFDDSGTESGEDLRHLNPEVVEEVKCALSRLEGVIPGLDPAKRDAVSQLVTSLQSCLQLAPPPPVPPPPRRFGSRKALRNRHTVSVSADEIVQARKWVNQDNLQRSAANSTESILANVFRPVHFSPPAALPEAKYTLMTLVRKMYHKPALHKAAYFMEPGPQQGVVSFIEPDYKTPTVERSMSDNSSVYDNDYDPSIHLFTPEQSVQIAIHKAAINKQINREEVKRRESSEDGDVSSADEEEPQTSSAQRLLQLATDNEKKQRYSARNSKKLKMKRANTIDIPKPNKFYDYSSDDYGASADETRDDMGRCSFNQRQILPPSFEPKTENDHKFLAFLQQVDNKNPAKVMTYNPSARGGKHWHNRFSTIKTTFEKGEPKPEQSYSPTPAKLFWQNAQKQETKKEVEQKGKLPWTVKSAGENGVVVGSLTVAKPGNVNRFNHAPKSAFKPIEKKTFSPVASSASGSVKQLATQKFSNSTNSQEPKPTVGKLEVKTAPMHLNSIKTDNEKLAAFNQNAVSTHKYYNLPSRVLNHESPERRTPSAFAPYKQKSEAFPSRKAEETKQQFNSYAQPKFYSSNPRQPRPQTSQNHGTSWQTSSDYQPQYAAVYKHPIPSPKDLEGYDQLGSNHVESNNQAHKPLQAQTRVPGNYHRSSNQHTFEEKLPIERVHSKATVNHNGISAEVNHSNGPKFISAAKPVAKVYPEQQPISLPTDNFYNTPINGALGAKSIGNGDLSRPQTREQIFMRETVNGKFCGSDEYNSERVVAAQEKQLYLTEGETAKIPVQFSGGTSAQSPPTIPLHHPAETSVQIPPPMPLQRPSTMSVHNSSAMPFQRPSAMPVQSPPAMCLQNVPELPVHAPAAMSAQSSSTMHTKLPAPTPVQSPPAAQQVQSPSFPTIATQNPVFERSPQIDSTLYHSLEPPTIGTVTDCSDLNQEVQGFTDIRDTRVLESQDLYLSNEAASGQYICNLRDASTINTDGEFVSNVLATSPGLRDSHYISPRPKSRSPTSSTPPMPTRGSVMEMTSYDNVYYNNTVSSKPPSSISFYPSNGDSYRERPKTSSPYLSGRTESPQSLSPVRSSSARFSPDRMDGEENECRAVSRVMGQAQCQTAVTINNRTRTRFDEPTKLDLRIQLTQSARQKALSPSFPNVLQKSESWHQLVKEQMTQAKQAPPIPNANLPKISRAKSSHSLNQYKQFEASLQPDDKLATKKITVSQYLSKKAKHSQMNKMRHKSLGNISTLEDDMDNVDEAFESIFQENSRKRNSK